MALFFFLFIVYSFDGILVFGLLFICTCAYFKKVPRLNNWLLSEKKGVWGVFYKGTSASNGTDIVTNYHTLDFYIACGGFAQIPLLGSYRQILKGNKSGVYIFESCQVF